MTCSKCGQTMEKGSVSVKGSLPSFLVVGLSYQSLWWYPAEGRREKLLKPGPLYDAFRCSNCGTVTIPAEAV